MIRTAVIVGEITATDWANRAGNPRTLARSPICFCTSSVDGVVRVIVIVTTPSVVPPTDKTG